MRKKIQKEKKKRIDLRKKKGKSTHKLGAIAGHYIHCCNLGLLIDLLVAVKSTSCYKVGSSLDCPLSFFIWKFKQGKKGEEKDLKATRFKRSWPGSLAKLNALACSWPLLTAILFSEERG